jgi:hypothetical protein
MHLHEGTLEALALKPAKPEDIPHLDQMADLLFDAVQGFRPERT